MKNLFWILLIVFLLGLGGAAQTDPVFRVRSELIPVYVTVTDGKDRPVRQLTASDFRIFENGVEQTVELFEELQWLSPGRTSRPPNPHSAEDEKGEAAEAVEAANEPPMARIAEHRFVVIRFDGLIGTHYSNGRYGVGYDQEAGPAGGFRRTHLTARDVKRAQAAAREFVKWMDPENDYAAVSWSNLISEFSRDRERLLELIDMITPGKTEQIGADLNVAAEAWTEESTETLPAATRADGNAAAVLSANDSYADIFDPIPTQDAFFSETRQLTVSSHLEVSDLVSRLKHLRGRKVLLFFGDGLPEVSREDKNLRRFDPRYNARVFNDAGFTVYALSPRGMTTSAPYIPMHRSAIRGASYSPRARSQAVFHIPSNSGLDNIYLRRWTETTGGKAYYNRNNLEKGVREALDSLSHSYLLAYRSTSPEPDSKYRQIRVEVGEDSKLAVRHRGGYFATAPSGDEVRERTLATAMLSPSRFQEFPLETWVEADAAQSELRFQVSFPFQNIKLHETVAPGPKKGEFVPRYFQEIHIFVAAFSKSGAYLGSYEKPFFLDLGEEQLQSLREQNATLERTLRTQSGEAPAALKTVVVVGQNEQVAVDVLELR